MIVAGVMSGTSADGVDVALVEIVPPAVTDQFPALRLLTHEHFAYPVAVREAVLRVMEGGATTAAELTRLNWRLGQVYAECVAASSEKAALKPELVGCHGQTIYHQAVAEEYCGVPVRATWQIGEAAVIAEHMKVPVVSDFRPADLAAGGQGAPLVPLLDLCLFRSQTVNRVLLNLGGIANVTVIPAGADMSQVIAFDTGPANMVIDAVMQSLFGLGFDAYGKIGAGGRIVREVVTEESKAVYFSALPPKSCGREQFGLAYAERLVARCKALGVTDADVVATATALTSETILDAYERFCARQFVGGPVEMIAAGGGTRNLYLMRLLGEALQRHHVTLRTADEFGLPSEAKEAVAFALLAWMTWHGRTGNVVAATGASRPVVLGKVTR